MSSTTSLTRNSLEVYVSIIVANIPTLRPLFTQKSWKSGPKPDNYSSSEARLRYTKVSGDSRGLYPYNTPSYSTEATTERTGNTNISLERIGGIRRVVDVKVSV